MCGSCMANKMKERAPCRLNGTNSENLVVFFCLVRSLFGAVFLFCPPVKGRGYYTAGTTCIGTCGIFCIFLDGLP